jgi:hypothetical protein
MVESSDLYKEIPMTRRAFRLLLGSMAVLWSAQSFAQVIEYKLLATTKTSTMEKELNAAAEEGFRFNGVKGGETAFGGQEVVALMSRLPDSPTGRFAYKLVATSRTSTMQKELQEAADAGYVYQDQTIFESFFGGEEIVIILERDKELPIARDEYKLLATSKTSTLQKELGEAGAAGYAYVGFTLGKTAMGGQELVIIMKRSRADR